MLLSEESKRQFAVMLEYCRGNRDVPTGVRVDRAPTYRRLVENIVFGNLEKAYPITRKRLTEDEWSELTERFFFTWSCPCPELWRMPYALIEFVESTEIAQELGLPWLSDLLHFEWAEIEVFMMPDHKYQDAPGSIKDIWNDTLVINQEYRFLPLSYCVHHQVSLDELCTKGEFFLICYRHPCSLEAMYMEVSPFFLRIFQELVAMERSAADSFHLALTEASVFDSAVQEKLREQVHVFLETLIANGLVLGSVCSNLED